MNYECVGINELSSVSIHANVLKQEEVFSCIRKYSSTLRTPTSPLFHCLGTPYGCRDVMRKHSRRFTLREGREEGLVTMKFCVRD